jgi:hypothetical protein
MMREWRYSSTHSITSTIDGGAWSASPPGNESWYPLDRRQGGPQSWSGHGVEENNSQPPTGIEPRSIDRPTRSQSLHRLSYPDSSYALVHIFNCECSVRVIMLCLCLIPYKTLIFMLQINVSKRAGDNYVWWLLLVPTVQCKTDRVPTCCHQTPCCFTGPWVRKGCEPMYRTIYRCTLTNWLYKLYFISYSGYGHPTSHLPNLFTHSFQDRIL